MTEDRQRWIALYVLCAGMLMIVIDATIVNVALPTIQDDLGFAQNDLAWVVNAYLVPYGGLLLLAGRLGDLAGQRRIFLLGLAVFTLASAWCAVSQSQEMLIAARFVQGIGGALTAAVILGMIVSLFPEQREQARALGVFAFVASAGGSMGLLVGGAITEAINWHWIFAINVPIGIVTAWLAIRLIPERPGLGLDRGADLPGAAVLTVGLMLGVYAIVGVVDHGWGSFQTAGLGAISAAMVAGFVVRQARIENPLMPLRLFHSRNVVGANIIQALMIAGMFGMFFLGALYLQEVLGYGPLEVGLAFLPSTIAMAVMSLRVSERVSMRYGPRMTLIPSLVLIGVGLLLFARTGTSGDYVGEILPPMVLMGTGAGLGFPALMMLAMSGATQEDSGLASGLVNTSLEVGGAIGLAVLATLSTERTRGLLDDGAARLEALNSGYHLAYVIGAALIVVGLAVAVWVLEHTPPPPMTMGEDEDGTAGPAGEREQLREPQPVEA